MISICLLYKIISIHKEFNVARWGYLAILFLVITIFITNTSQAISTWDTKNGDIAFHKQSQKTALIGQTIPDEYAIKQLHCQKMDFTIKVRFIDGILQIGSEEKLPVCAVPVPGGYMSQEGYYLKNGTTLAGKLSTPDGSKVAFRPIANSNNLIAIYTSNSNNVRIFKNTYSSLSFLKNDQEIFYKIQGSNPNFLTSISGSVISAVLSTVSVSGNGEWLLLEDKSKYITRINIDSLDKLNIANGFNYNLGYNPNPLTALSDNGNLAIVASGATSTFNLYDLTICTSATNCFKRDLQNDLKKHLPNFSSAYNIRFINNSISIVGINNIISGVSRVLGKYYIGAPNTQLQSLENNYIALGDSFASGEGAYEYIKYTDTADNRCHQSAISYPFIIKKNLTSLISANSVACSGAKMKDIYSFNESQYNEYDSQAKKKTNHNFDNEIYSNYLPGYRSQHNFLNKNTQPNIITLSIFGNDIGFSSLIKRCVAMPDDCYKNKEDRLEIINNINSNYNLLLDNYKTIKQKAVLDAKIYVIGYPQIIKTAGNCGVNVRLSNEELAFANDLTNYINLVIKNASDANGMYFVDTRDAFIGHRLCETNANNTAINGVTAGNSAPLNGIGPLASESFHPNKLGHELLADLIATQTNNFTNTMPEPKDSVALPDPYSLNIIKSAPSTNRQTYISRYDPEMTQEILYKDKPFNVNINNLENGVKPNQEYSVMLYSDPVNLGTIISNSDNIDANINLPNVVEPGYHTIKIEGPNLIGEMISIQKIVYVADAQNETVKSTPQNITQNTPQDALPSKNYPDNTQTDNPSQPDTNNSLVGSVIDNIYNNFTVGQYLINLGSNIDSLSGFRANSDIDSSKISSYSPNQNLAKITQKTKDTSINMLFAAMFLLFAISIFIIIYKIKLKAKNPNKLT